MQTIPPFLKTVVEKVRSVFFGFEKKEQAVRAEAEKVLADAVAKADARHIDEIKNNISKL